MVRINKPHWQSSGIILLCKYHIVISDTLVGFSLDVLFLLLSVILSELYEKTRTNKDCVTEKSTKKNLCERHHFFWLHTLPTMSFFVAFFVYAPSKWLTCCITPAKIHNISMGGILCDIENMKITCNLILAGWYL